MHGCMTQLLIEESPKASECMQHGKPELFVNALGVFLNLAASGEWDGGCCYTALLVLPPHTLSPGPDTYRGKVWHQWYLHKVDLNPHRTQRVRVLDVVYRVMMLHVLDDRVMRNACWVLLNLSAGFGALLFCRVHNMCSLSPPLVVGLVQSPVVA